MAAVVVECRSNVLSEKCRCWAKNCSTYIQNWNIWKAILLGQIVSLLNCCTAITSQYLGRVYQVNAPTAQSFLNYCLLCAVYTSILCCRSNDNGLVPVLRKRGWKYLLLSIVDVEGNYFVVKAYQYTTLTSVQLLDCFTIPTVLLLSWIFLRTRYSVLHVCAVTLCLIGVGCVILADVEEGHGSDGGDMHFLGDVLCLIGATFYGICNVGEEFLVKNFDRVEFLGMLGLFGSFINGAQLMLLEREELAGVKWHTWQIDALFAGFAVSLFCFYSLVPYIMRLSSATALNLSILTCDFYSLIAAIFIFHYQFYFLYLLSFVLVVVGVVVYFIQPVASAANSSNRFEEPVIRSNSLAESYRTI